MTGFPYSTIAETIERLKRKEISPVELVQAHLRRIEALQPRLNAFVHVDGESALARARATESAILRGEFSGVLAGIPLSMKSNTNVPEFLMSYETDSLIQGKTANPWNLAYSAGGSSGGEAAAIASGCSMGGVGSDGGGSIRTPAHFCGVCGLKPTPGRIPSTGHFPPGAGALSWLGVVGPMARTVADLRALFEVMAGPDPGDAMSAPVPLRQIRAND